MNAKLYKTEKENYVLVDPTKGTYDDGYMLGTSRESQYNKLSIKNCQAIECGYDLDELAKEEAIKISETEVRDEKLKRIYKRGFQKALELNNTKLYTLEDMMNCWNKALTFQDHKELFGYHIQSLKQTEWDVEVVTQKYLEGYEMIGHQKGVYGSGNRIPIYNSKPKLDADGCLILKRID